MNASRAWLVAACFALAIASAEAGARRWSKHHQMSRDPETGLSTSWTSIYTNDDLLPFLERVLYRDARGDLLVIRTVRSGNPDAPGPTIIEHVSTKESVALESFDQKTFVVTAGEQLVSVRRDATAAASSDGSDFPAQIEAEAAVLFASLTLEFRQALHRLAGNGCRRSVDFFPVAKRVGLLFFEDVACDSAPSTSPTPVDWVVDFEPAGIAPGEFELPFGAAYYE